MEQENDQRAGGVAQSKDVDGRQEPDTADDSAESEDAGDTQKPERAGGAAQSKGVS